MDSDIFYGQYVMDSGQLFKDVRGVSAREYLKYGCHIKDVVLSSGAAERTGYSEGRYITVEPGDDGNAVMAGGELLRSLMEQYNSRNVLCVGIGNPRMTTDRLGVATVAALGKTDVKTFCPSVESITHMPTVDIIDALVTKMEPDIIIAVDSLCARSYSRLGKSYQLTNAGIQIGGGVGHGRELSMRTVGVPVIGLGVPTVISARNLLGEYMRADHLPAGLIVTPGNIDNIISQCSETAAEIIKKAL